MVETIALWWCYAVGGTAALGVYGVVFMWAADKVIEAFKLKRLFLTWYGDHLRAEKKARG